MSEIRGSAGRTGLPSPVISARRDAAHNALAFAVETI